MKIALKKIAASAGFATASALFGIPNAQAALPIEHWTQPSGAQVYLVTSPAVPMVDAQIDFDAGSRRDPAAQAGLAGVTAGMQGRGVRATRAADGTPLPALDENALGEAWADLGASFGGSAGEDRTSYSLRSLTDPALLARAAQLAARQLGEPAFDPAVWQRQRQRIDAALREADTRPGTVAGKAFESAVYGSHPYGRQTTPATLARIEAGDLRAFHDRLLRACGAKVSIVGAVDRAGADRLATALLSRLPAQGCAPLPAVPEVAPLAAARDQRIPFDAAQAQVLIGQPGIARSDPDYFPLLVGNHILGGGGFVSRLTSEVREKRGLTYGIDSGFAPGLHAGAFTIGLKTRPDQAAQAVDQVRGILRDFVADGPTPAELQAAKDNLIGGFPLRIDSNRKLVGNLANIAWHGLPLDYLDTWTAQIRKVGVADIQAAFARVLQPGRMVTVVVGGRP
jgi:zinc protease